MEIGLCGCKHGKVDQKVLRYTQITMFLVKGLKAVAKCCLNWNSFHDDLCCCVEYLNVEKSS